MVSVYLNSGTELVFTTLKFHFITNLNNLNSNVNL